MRTFYVALTTESAEGSITVSTEAIIGDDAEAENAGREARAALDAFTNGYAEDPR